MVDRPKPPMPGPCEDDIEYLFENYESDYAWQVWQSALDWARKGDFVPLVECLRRSDLPLNNDDVRAWLADGLIGGFKKPRNTAKRPEHVPFEMDGRHFHVDKRHLTIFQAMKLVGETKASLGEDEAINSAASTFEMMPETLRVHLPPGAIALGITSEK